MVRLLFFLSVVFSQLCSNAQNSNRPDASKHTESSLLSGKVLNEVGDSLPGASIIIHDANTGTFADASGHYSVKVPSARKYLVEVSFLGYSTAIDLITVKGLTQKSFVLSKSAVEQDAVIVTGVSSATRLRQNPQPISILKRDELQRITSTNIIGSLSHVAGVNAVTTGPAIAKPFIRGLGYNRVVTINDGVKQEGQQWGDEHGIEVDDYSVQRIEVLKGPASLMYGSDALAGVINIQTLNPATEGSTIGSVLSEYQSNSNLRGFFGNAASTKRGFSWSVYGSYKAAADYKNKYDGYVFNSKFLNKNFGGLIGYAGKWGHSYLRVTNYHQKVGVIEGDRDPASGSFFKPIPGGGETIATHHDFRQTAPFVPYQNIQHFKITSDNNYHVGRSRLDVALGYQRNQRQEFGDADDLSTPEAHFDLQTGTYALRLHLPYTSNFKTSIGVTGMYQGNTNKAEEAIIPNYRLFDAGLYGFTQYSYKKVNISGGLRVDNRHIESLQMLTPNGVKFSAFKRNFTNVSGSVGMSYEASSSVILKANVARGFRAPNLAELASNGAHEGTNRYEVGNSNLNSEVSTQFDAGIEINSEHISFTAGAFYNSIQNFLFYKRMLNMAGGDSMLVDVESGDLLEVFNFNQQNARLYGGEFNIDIHPHPLDWLHFENTFSYTRARFSAPVGGSRNVPFIPAAKFISQLRGRFMADRQTIRNLYVSFEGDYTFSQNKAFTAFNTETATAGYLLLNTAIGADVMSKKKTLFTLHLSINNMADVAYQSHLSRLKYTDVNNATGRQGVYNMGRNFAVKVNVPFVFKSN